MLREVSVTFLMTVLLRSFLTLIVLVFVRGFSYTPDSSFSEECLTYSAGGSFSEDFLMIVLVKSFTYTHHGSFSEEFYLHSS